MTHSGVACSPPDADWFLAASIGRRGSRGAGPQGRRQTSKAHRQGQRRRPTRPGPHREAPRGQGPVAPSPGGRRSGTCSRLSGAVLLPGRDSARDAPRGRSPSARDLIPRSRTAPFSFLPFSFLKRNEKKAELQLGLPEGAELPRPLGRRSALLNICPFYLDHLSRLFTAEHGEHSRSFGELNV